MKKHLMELKKLFLTHGARWKRWRGLVTVMAMAVVFVTTYALILPAITLEKSQGKPEQGVYLDPMERGSTAALNNEEAENVDQPDELADPGTGNQGDQTKETGDTMDSDSSIDIDHTENTDTDNRTNDSEETAFSGNS